MLEANDRLKKGGGKNKKIINQKIRRLGDIRSILKLPGLQIQS
jgi:hypothetical protein